MVGPIDMQSVILNSYTQSSINNNLLIQAAQADSIKRIAQKKQNEEESTKVESASNTQNPTINEHEQKDKTNSTSKQPQKKHIDIKV